MGAMGLDQISVRVTDGNRIELGYAGLAADRSCLDDIVRFASLTLHWVVDDPAKAKKTEVVSGRAPDTQSYTLDAEAVVTGEMVKDARPIVTAQGEKAIAVTLDKSGTRKLAEATAKGLGHRLAIVLDGEVISAPTVREPIEGGAAEITGPGGAEDLAADLRACQLSAPVRLAQ
jgi:preprotein translocase subunit SecD